MKFWAIALLLLSLPVGAIGLDMHRCGQRWREKRLSIGGALVWILAVAMFTFALHWGF